MLRDLLTFNSFASRNKMIISIEMAKIGGGAPRTIWMGNVMVCTCNIQPINMMIMNKKTTGIGNTTKREGPRVQGIVETQMAIVEKKNQPLCPHRSSLNYVLTMEYTRLK